MKKQSVSVAKINQPTAAGMLFQERLFQRLEDCANCPVVWISGPAGSGKTTLVSSYIEARDLPCLWYKVDSGDADLFTFFYYLGLAGKNTALIRSTCRFSRMNIVWVSRSSVRISSQSFLIL